MTRTISQRALAAAAAFITCAGVVTAAARADQNEGIPTVSAAAESQIAAGGLSTCAVLHDRTVQCWGSNDQGQLGNGTVTTSTDPVTVPNLSNVLAITAGNTHTCALVDDGSGVTGTVKCWGLAANGQLGDGSVGEETTNLTKDPQRRSPVTVVKDASNTPLSGVVAVAAGGFHTCAVVKDGAGNRTAWCWGDDGEGQLGDGKPGDRTAIAQPVTNLGSTVSALALGEFHSCALLDDGTVKCWGANPFGQLTVDPTTLASSATPVAASGLPDPTSNPVVALTAGYGHVCALLKDNSARCWGENNFGQLGYETPHLNGDSSKPMVPSSTPGVVQGATGPTPAPPSPPVPPHANQGQLVAITAGEFHTCALTDAGAVRCWGQGGRGQLGEDPNPYSSNSAQIDDSTFAVDVHNLSGSATAVTAGGFHTCAAISGASMQCWGYNFYGQLGSSAPSSLVPVQVSAVTGAKVVTAGTNFACALIDTKIAVVPVPTAAPTGRPFCWGDNSTGQLGTSQSVAKASIRIAVDGFGTASALDAGNGHACALPASSQTPMCWGLNDVGQVGDGTTTSPRTPVAVTGLTTASTVSAGGALGPPERGHSCAVRADTKVVCWGRDTRGQLGNGAFDDHDASPVVVQYDTDPDPNNVSLGDLTGLTSVVTGGFHSCALASDATVWCWGYDASGQLGDGATATRNYAAHVQVNPDPDPDADNPLTGVVSLTAGAGDTCAVMTNGSLKCWGDNGHGQLGDGSTSDRHLPKQVSGFDGSDDAHQATTVSAGDEHTCAVLVNGALECWGANGAGQLGDGSTSDHSSPTQVSGALFGPTSSDVGAQFRPIIRSLSASRNNTCAAIVDTTVYCWGDNTFDQLGDGIGATSVDPKTVNLVSSL